MSERSMTHKWHGKALLMAIRHIDSFVEECSVDGSVPVLDAVETSRLLKALVRADESHRPDVDTAMRRLSRMQTSALNPVAKTTACVIPLGWGKRDGQ